MRCIFVLTWFLSSKFSWFTLSNSWCIVLYSAFFFNRHFLADFRFYINLKMLAMTTSNFPTYLFSFLTSLSSEASDNWSAWSTGRLTWMSRMGLGFVLPFADVGADFIRRSFTYARTMSAFESLAGSSVISEPFELILLGRFFFASGIAKTWVATRFPRVTRVLLLWSLTPASITFPVHSGMRGSTSYWSFFDVII